MSEQSTRRSTVTFLRMAVIPAGDRKAWTLSPVPATTGSDWRLVDFAWTDMTPVRPPPVSSGLDRHIELANAAGIEMTDSAFGGDGTTSAGLPTGEDQSKHSRGSRIQGAALEASLQDRSIWIDPARHERPLSKREGTHNRCRPVGRRRFRTAVPRLEGLIHTSGQSRSRCSNNPGETLRKSSLGEIIAHATR